MKIYLFFALCIAVVVLAAVAFAANNFWYYLPAGIFCLIISVFILTEKCAGNE